MQSLASFLKIKNNFLTKNIFYALFIFVLQTWARRVAWYPCSFGSYRLEFKSQRAHFSINRLSYTSIEYVGAYAGIYVEHIGTISPPFSAFEYTCTYVGIYVCR